MGSQGYVRASVHACTGMTTCLYLNVWVFCKYRMKEVSVTCAYVPMPMWPPGFSPPMCVGSAVRKGRATSAGLLWMREESLWAATLGLGRGGPAGGFGQD